MTSYTATASVKGQIVIPAPLRHKYAIHDGTRILVEDGGDRIVLRPITEAMVRELRGSLKGKGALAALLAERAADREREG
ncbi:MAG: AbrB/MazE/SpoVT family DNA-binding domain-containing protein [Anaerolineae bacterium]